MMQLADRTQELVMKERGYQFIVGVDEAGAGALAGPVVAGAVILSDDHPIEGLGDSKLLTEKKREKLYSEIILHAQAWAFGMATVEEIEVLGIRPANYLAMRRAVEKIPHAQFALVDAWTIPQLPIPQQGIIRGDRSIACIAAGSIIAKVTRDRMMVDFHERFPQYGFDIHKGYGTKVHRDAIKEHGPSAIHRMSFTLA